VPDINTAVVIRKGLPHFSVILLTRGERHCCETGMELCGWPKLGVPRGAVPHEIPRIGTEARDVRLCFRNSHRRHVVCVRASVGMPAAAEWPSAVSVVQTVTCLGSFPQTHFIPSGAESLFYHVIATDSLDWWYPANTHQHQSQRD